MGSGIRHTEEQVIKVMKEIDPGLSVVGSVRTHGISEQTICRRRERFGGMSKSELGELKSLQEESRWLRHLAWIRNGDQTRALSRCFAVCSGGR